MRQLTENEFLKLSEITGISDFEIQKLYNMGLLKERIALNFLIRYDFQDISRRGLYRKSQIVTRLMEYYNVSKNMALAAINNKKRKLHYCSQCQQPITRYQYQRNNGVCDRCIAKTIEISSKTS